MITDREVAFVLNGLRNYGRAFNELAGIDPDDADRLLEVAVKALNIPAWLLEETRIDQQAIVARIQELTSRRWTHGS